jgi:2-polyprenyl-6-methoxyphenol hydroxylase-like FAD-dependent oxidoreductase
MSLKAIIIGGGIGGLTAAIALGQAGIQAEVYEQAAALNEVGAGVGLWANAVRSLSQIGLTGEVLQLAGGTLGLGVKRPDGQWLFRHSKDVMDQRWGAGFVAVHRAELQSLLLRALDPASVHLGARCQRFEQLDGSVRVQLDNGVEVVGDVLIGADGVHSVVATPLLSRRPLTYRGYTTLRAVTPPGSVPTVGEAVETWGIGRRFGLQPTSGHRILWYAAWNSPPHGPASDHAPERLLQRFGAWHEPIRAVIEATRPESTVRTDIYDRWPTTAWTRGRVALLGDAIHPMTPDLGQGACQAIVDATTLADCLAGTVDVPTALRSYRRQRMKNAAMTTVLARAFGAVGQWEHRRSCAARDALLKALPESFQLRQLDLIVGRVRSTGKRGSGC